MLWETYENPESNLSGNLVVTNDETVFGQTISGDVGFFGSLYSLSTANQYHPFAQMQIGANFWGTSGATGLSGATTADVIGAALGISPTNSLAGFDTFELALFNDNEDVWWFNLHLNTGYTDQGEANNYYENGWTAVNPGSCARLVVDLSNVANLEHVTNIGFNVGGNLTGTNPDPSNPDFFHVSAAPVPEPSTLILLGGGLLGLGFLRRKKG